MSEFAQVKHLVSQEEGVAQPEAEAEAAKPEVKCEEWVHAGVSYAVKRWDAPEDVSVGAPAAPLVMLHGFAQNAASWDKVAERLAVGGRTVYAPDLVGHGNSSRPDNPAAYTLTAQAAALVAFLASVGAAEGARPIVVGYSMGGRVALTAVWCDPAAFACNACGLVLESAGLGPVTEDDRRGAAKLDVTRAAKLRADGVKSFMDEWQALPLFATQFNLPPDVQKRVHMSRLANNAEVLARTFERAGQHAMPAQTDTCLALVRLQEYGVPVFYLAGSHDKKYCNVAATAHLQCGCEMQIIEDAGHNIHLEAPEAFVREVTACAAACQVSQEK